MTELRKIHLLSNGIRTCFFYKNINESFKNCPTEVIAIKVSYGPNFEFTVFGSINYQALPCVPQNYLGVSTSLATSLKLKEDDTILFSFVNLRSIESLEISTKKEEDFAILLGCKSYIESDLLNQVRVVSKGQTLPLHIFGNILVNIKLDNFKPQVEAGVLEKLTKVTLLSESEPLISNHTLPSEIKCVHSSLNNQFIFNNFIPSLNFMISSNLDSSKSLNSEKFYVKKFKKSKVSINRFLILPNLLLSEDDVAKKIIDKFIFIPNIYDNSEKNCFGPHSKKFFCEIHLKTKEKINSTICSSNKYENHTECDKNLKENCMEKNFTNKLYCYAVSFDCNNNFKVKGNIAFCPIHLMQKLNIFVGTEVEIHIVKKDLINKFYCVSKDKTFNEKKYCLFKHLEKIKMNITENIKNNIKYGFKLNTLIIGNSGTGKSYLINALLEDYSTEFIFTQCIKCKRLRGKKLEALYKILVDALISCCQNQPSILLIDDLHALTQFDESEEKFNKFYSNRVITMISDFVKSFQKENSLSVIATSTGFKELGNLVSARGPRLFTFIEKIPNLSLSDRISALNQIIEQKCKSLKKNNVEINKLADATGGYTVQDLYDFVDKSIIKSLIKGTAIIDDVDFDLALSECEPLNLRGITRKRKVKNIQWNDVGGMEHAKKTLTEVFSWPLKYPELLKSCPLKIQKGVLLYGVPGTGKTLLAGALAEKFGLNFISVKGPEILSKYVGASEQGIRNLFVEAQKKQPCLLFFDEFDSLAPKRGYDSTGVTDRVVNQLLTQMDGVETINGVGVLVATSRPDLIDPALLRPGRLDKIIFCDLPKQDERSSILTILSKNLAKNGNDFNLEKIAQLTESYTGADLQAILTNAQILAIKNEKRIRSNVTGAVLCQEHLLKAFHETKPSLSKAEKLRFSKIYERFRNSRKKYSSATHTNMFQKIILA